MTAPSVVPGRALDLDVTRARLALVVETGHRRSLEYLLIDDVPKLIAEVERWRAVPSRDAGGADR